MLGIVHIQRQQAAVLYRTLPPLTAVKIPADETTGVLPLALLGLRHLKVFCFIRVQRHNEIVFASVGRLLAVVDWLLLPVNDDWLIFAVRLEIVTLP